ncbi:MAG TPA: hypothetical protein DCR93_06320 [Cytophagales bacterium]|nr:hypothetical protein [Cytophagales bacterium]HAP59125.1 hypothetical protein [Cytophagales bacterium]
MRPEKKHSLVLVSNPDSHRSYLNKYEELAKLLALNENMTANSYCGLYIHGQEVKEINHYLRKETSYDKEVRRSSIVDLNDRTIFSLLNRFFEEKSHLSTLYISGYASSIGDETFLEFKIDSSNQKNSFYTVPLNQLFNSIYHGLKKKNTKNALVVLDLEGIDEINIDPKTQENFLTLFKNLNLVINYRKPALNLLRGKNPFLFTFIEGLEGNAKNILGEIKVIDLCTYISESLSEHAFRPEFAYFGVGFPVLRRCKGLIDDMEDGVPLRNLFDITQQEHQDMIAKQNPDVINKLIRNGIIMPVPSSESATTFQQFKLTELGKFVLHKLNNSRISYS